MGVAAASLAFNVGTWVQRSRVARIKVEEARDGIWANEEDEEWEVELVSAVAEALVGEDESEDAGELYVSCARPMVTITIMTIHGRGEITSLMEPTFFF